MNIDLFVGIDVGKEGAIASYDVINNSYEVVDIPTTIEAVSDYLSTLKERSDRILVCVEQVFMWRGDATAGKLFRTEKMVRTYNEMTTILRMLKIPHVRVTAIEWQTWMNLRNRNDETYYQRKKRLYQSAQYKYPQVAMRMNQADAMLIMGFLMKKYQYDREWIEKKIPNTVIKQML